jgi:hypothetical protein
MVVNKNGQSRFQKGGLVLGGIAITLLAAATTWAAPPTGAKQSSQDNAAARQVRRDDTPPATSRRAEGSGQQQFPRSSGSTSRSSGAGRESIANRRVDQAPIANRNIRSGDSTPPVRNVESNRLAQRGQPPVAGNRSGDSAKDKDVVKDTRKEAVKDVVKDRGTDKANKDLPAKGIQGTKNLGSPSTGNKSSIDDVRKRFDAKNGPKDVPKNIQPQPDHRAALDAAKGKNVQNNAFQERLKSGNLNQLTAGKTAKNLKLAEQYRLYQTGDVARRLALEKRGNHPTIHGVVSPIYERQCVRYHYWGPSFFAGVCWYPRWNPWVEWSWRHHCNPYWDPRPFWCRPVVYVACPTWTYWNTPAWAPLPVVACGTWVDLRPVVSSATAADLQLVAVRFVDPGHPEEKLGPRYRVWFRNNSSQPIAQPFNVMLFAGNDRRLAAGMLQAGVRVTGIDGGDMQSVDIRLPVEVYAMRRDARGNPVPFSVLQVLVDANREVAETTMANNGACLVPADILPVDPASFELQPTAAKPGEEILLAGEGYGPQPGRVLVQVNGREMDGEILGWYDLGVQWTMPKLALAGPVEADVVVIRGDGAAANPVKVTLTP